LGADAGRKLDLFTNRYSAIRKFVSLLNTDPPEGGVLYYHGEGGNGKSLLLKFLRSYCTKRFLPENWEYIKDVTDEEFVSHVKYAEDVEGIPHVLIDFGMQPAGDSRPQEPFSALLMVHRDLAKYGLQFPLFDFACVWYLHKTSRLSADRLRDLFPTEELAFVTELMGAVVNTPWVSLASAVLGVFGKHLREGHTLKTYMRKLSDDLIDQIRDCDPETELIEQLPGLLARDLCQGFRRKNAPARVVLFFDTHEAIWGDRFSLSRDMYYQRDEWLRRLVNGLGAEPRVVVVVAGRESPRWDEAPIEPVQSVQSWQVDGLSDEHARIFLLRAGVADEAMRAYLADYARMGPNQVHPLLLGLAADVVLLAQRKGIAIVPGEFPADEANRKARHLVDQFLRYSDRETADAVRAVSACRAFDLSLYLYLAERLHFQASRARFESLTSFSFVWKVEGTSGVEDTYRIHTLLSRLLRDQKDDLVLRSHEELGRHYTQKAAAGSEDALVEAIYHVTFVIPDVGTSSWCDEFQDAIDRCRFAYCRRLFEIRSELDLPTPYDRFRVSQLEGQYYQGLSRYEEAERKYLEAEASLRAVEGNHVEDHLMDYAGLLARLGGLLAMGDSVRAEQHLLAAIDVLNQVLAIDASSNAAHTNKGTVLEQLGKIYIKWGRYEQAQDTLRKAISEHSAILQIDPADSKVLNNLGNDLGALGHIQHGVGNFECATDSYLKALNSYAAAKDLGEASLHICVNSACTLTSLGDLYAGRGAYELADEVLAQAVAACASESQDNPEVPIILGTKGTALLRWGEAFLDRGAYERATQCLEQAVSAFDTALGSAPHYHEALCNRGLALSLKAEVLYALREFENAAATAHEAADTFTNALRRSVNDPITESNMAQALTRLADSLAALKRNDEARHYFDQANEVVRACQASASLHREVTNTVIIVFVRRGRFMCAHGEQEAGLADFHTALAECDRFLAVNPSESSAWVNHSTTWSYIAAANEALDRKADAIEALSAALGSIDRALMLAPNVLALLNKGKILIDFCHLLSAFDQKSARHQLVQAIRVLQTVTTKYPHHPEAIWNLAYALIALAERRRGNAGRLKLYRTALQVVDKGISAGAGDESLWELRDLLVEGIAEFKD
jgi:tetratricopeptide (TPR) repeat protein